ncbi:hypothetical protein KM043_003779 [Ampulex compressa]|nr:hypothetical protein KM043_003779 [Ampulex compressa]
MFQETILQTPESHGHWIPTGAQRLILYLAPPSLRVGRHPTVQPPGIAILVSASIPIPSVRCLAPRNLRGSRPEASSTPPFFPKTPLFLHRGSFPLSSGPSSAAPRRSPPAPRATLSETRGLPPTFSSPAAVNGETRDNFPAHWIGRLTRIVFRVVQKRGYEYPPLRPTGYYRDKY